MIHLQSGEPEPAHAQGRKLGPADGFLQQLGRFDAREHDSLRAHIESARNERILQFRDAHHWTKADKRRDAADILHGFEIESAVLGVDESPVESRIVQDANDVLGAQLAEAGSELHLARGERLFNGIDSHERLRSDQQHLVVRTI